jgi:hypothetical protein
MLTKVTMLVAACVLGGAAISAAPAVAGSWHAAAYESDRQGIAVSTMSSPQMLRGKMVEDRYGRTLGRVVSISMDREGKAEVVNIEVGGLLNLGSRVMPFAADRIVYYPTNARLVASNDPSPVAPPRVDANSPTRASIKRQAPSPTIIRY